MPLYLLPPLQARTPRSTLTTGAAVAGVIVLALHLAGLFALDWLLGRALPTSTPVSITSSEMSVVVKAEPETEAAKTP